MTRNPQKIRPNCVIGTSKYLEEYTFTTLGSDSNSVPIYLINTVYDLNKIIGYIKYINKDYGNVVYRGQCHLHETMTPSLYHDGSNASDYKKVVWLNKLIYKINNDKDYMHTLISDKESFSEDARTLIIEAILQHYGIPTRCIDAVDNHWIALWFGAYRYYQSVISKTTYATYQSRAPKPLDLISPDKKDDDFFQYMILIAVDDNSNWQKPPKKEVCSINLRNVIPSTYLRPHAQHGIILKRNTPADHCDISTNVVGILKIRIDNAIQWLGNGTLVRFENLFPSQFHDHGYKLLLDRTDLFEGYYSSIVQYIYD